MIDILYYPYVNIEDDKKNPFNYRFLAGLNELELNAQSVRKNFGVVDLFLKFTKTKSYLFNFIENLPDRRFGIIQSIFFILFLILAKVFNKKILWCAHNKISHSRNKFFIKKLLFRLLAIFANKILVLSSSGKIFLRPFVLNNKKIFVINHPTYSFKNNLIKSKKDFDIDFLIWGEIFPYKGVSSFLDFCESSIFFKNKRIHIAGLIKDKNILNSSSYNNMNNLSIKNKFIDEKELIDLHLRSKYIFFSYEHDSAIASAALNFSLSLKSNILASNVGQFSDLGKKGLLNTYDNFEDIERILTNNTEPNISEISKYLKDNSWEKFLLKFNNDFLKK